MDIERRPCFWCGKVKPINEYCECGQDEKVMHSLTIEAWHQGTNLGRLEGYRMVVAGLGGQVESVTAKPPQGMASEDDDFWKLTLSVLIPPDRHHRCVQLAERMFDGAVESRLTGERQSGARREAAT